jgi:hypothetical protein
VLMFAMNSSRSASEPSSRLGTPIISTPVFCLVTHATAADSSRQLLQCAPQYQRTYGLPSVWFAKIASRPDRRGSGAAVVVVIVSTAGAASATTSTVCAAEPHAVAVRPRTARSTKIRRTGQMLTDRIVKDISGSFACRRQPIDTSAKTDTIHRRQDRF